MKPAARIVNEMFKTGLTDADRMALHYLRARIPGWSTDLHAVFFKAVLNELFHENSEPSLCICGVYHGMDLAIIEYMAGMYHEGKTLRLVGVDTFSPDPCADWPDEKRGMTWRDAFNCAPPDMGAAIKNAPGAKIIKGTAVSHLIPHASDYHFVYLDTSHDYETVNCEISAVKTGAILKDGRIPILAGDDYAENGGGFECGVKRAVERHLPDHLAIGDRIWVA